MRVLNGGTLRAEVRYLGSYVGAVAIFLIPVAVGTFVGKVAHLSFAAIMLLVFALMGVLGWAAIVMWWRNRNSVEPTESARYAPIVFPLVLLCVEAYWIVTSMPPLQPVAWKDGSAGAFASLCVSFGVFAYYTLKDWRARYLKEAQPPVPQFTQQRLDQFSGALQLQDVSARRRALRPLLTRGYIRIALLISEVVLMIALVPRVGIAASLVGSLLCVGGIFLLGRIFFDL